MMQIDIQILPAIAREAGNAIMGIYNDPAQSGEVERKADDSPLTLADKASHEVIVAALARHFPGIPVLSEEGRKIPFEERKNWHTYWCVDPLDGTKEFVKRNGEFTVNIALIRDRKPVMGVIHVPVTGVTYYADQAGGAWKTDAAGNAVRLQTSRADVGWTAVGSRSHGSPEEAAVLARYPVTNQISVGSSIKFCIIAEGLAHIYFRQGPTMEWDTAAGQAILECSGGKMTNALGEPFLYNKESLLNGSFLCLCQ
ncbi:3'(2'),5'-bisphosphate nucleotidase CysQ [Dyadobacter sp. BHUBP1]|uniref:3'(2'),5'-bisphosphate nucleotidase CysQ n=1 Tax=Dyadobacter sp. BHUBP1 TaxID=3424178 RepID=UPI003D33B267